MVYALDLHENLIEAKSIAIPLMPAPKSLRVRGTELNTPQSDRLVADTNATLGHKILNIASAQIEAMLEPKREACPWATTCWMISGGKR